jgi:tetratricopeptide (TPR) repeat protein
MPFKRTHNLTLELNEKTLSFFPEAIGKEKSAFNDAVNKRIRSAFQHLVGVIKVSSVNERIIDITWQDEQQGAGYLDKIANILTKGNYADGILLLELFLSEESENPDLLYNLGMAYSDQKNLERAITLLTKLVSLEPSHVNGRTALGVAFIRNNETEKGVGELQIAAKQEPDNLWARRNLGAGLMKLNRFSEAVEHLRIATELSPQDQQAWYGYGQALENVDNVEEADKAYIQTIEIDEYTQIAELARQARSNIAKQTFRETAAGIIRMDAVMYCLGALEKFESMTLDQIQKIGFEIAMLGRRGIDVNNPDTRYTIRTLPGDFSGLHLLSLEYVAFKKVAPEQNIGFDLANEYKMALTLFSKKTEDGD